MKSPREKDHEFQRWIIALTELAIVEMKSKQQLKQEQRNAARNAYMYNKN